MFSVRGLSLLFAILRYSEGSNAVDFIKSSDGTVTVRLRQTLIGSEETCGSTDPAHLADILFAVYSDATLGIPTCKKFRDKDACFKRNLVIGCESGVAKIDVYTRDASFSLQDSVVNPKVGGCLGTNSYISRTKKQTFTFGCEIDDNGTDEPLDGLCTDDTDCGEGSFCGTSFFPDEPRFCKSFSPVGHFCGTGAPGVEGRCDPSLSYCAYPMACTGLMDGSGTCLAIGGSCTAHAECGPEFYCDTSISVCKARMREFECCVDDNSCLPGLTCQSLDMGGRGSMVMSGGPMRLLQSSDSAMVCMQG